MRSPLVAACLAIGCVLLLVGCARPDSLPGPTPADFPGIAGAMSVEGIAIEDIVSGDAGCDDATLIPTSIGFSASGVDQATPTRIHVFIFRNREAYERLRPTVDTCARSIATDPETFETIDASPFVVVGEGPWAPGFKEAVRTAVTRAAGTGG